MGRMGSGNTPLDLVNLFREHLDRRVIEILTRRFLVGHPPIWEDDIKGVKQNSRIRWIHGHLVRFEPQFATDPSEDGQYLRRAKRRLTDLIRIWDTARVIRDHMQGGRHRIIDWANGVAYLRAGLPWPSHVFRPTEQQISEWMNKFHGEEMVWEAREIPAPIQIEPQPAMPELANGGEDDQGNRLGVSYLDAALLFETDRDTNVARQKVKRWQSLGKPAPKWIGNDPIHKQRKLTTPVEMLKFVLSVEDNVPTGMSQDSFLKLLKKVARRPMTLTTRQTTRTARNLNKIRL